MGKAERITGWVVYQMTIHGKAEPVNAVCEQREWEEMEANRPGYHKLIRAGILNEAEAEKLARGTAGDSHRPPLKRLR